VGLKPTIGLLSTEGVIPACRSLDCVTVMALTADDARWVCDVALEGRWPDPPPPTPLPGGIDSDFVFAAPRDEDLEFCGDKEQERLYHQGLARLERIGGRPVRIDFRPFREAADLLYGGPWLAERYAGLADFFGEHWDDLHPATREILQGALRYTGVDVFAGSYHLQTLRATCGKTFANADVLAVPTMPTLPTREAVQADSIGWSRRLGHYTNFANLLGLAAITLPNGFTPQGLPGSITLIGPGGSDLRLCELGAAWQRQANLPLGATGHRLPELSAADTLAPPRVPAGHVRVAVAGAHMRGQPLHGALRGFGARFVRACRTGAHYRFFAFLHLDPPRPALLREPQGGSAIAVEVYDTPVAGFGALVASVAPPLTIGTVELEDGEAVKGFLCESAATLKARDISEFGGWVAFRQRNERSR
jgi:allophanate hydrolase